MELRRFVNASRFCARAEPFLLRREAEHNLMLGICTDRQQGLWGEPKPYLALVEEDAVVAVVAVMTPPHNLVLSHCEALDAPGLVARDLYEGHWALPGVLGPSAISASFAERWQALTGQPYRRGMAMRIYQLTEVRPVVGVPGHLRRAMEADRAWLVNWWEAFNREAMDGGDREGAEKAVEQYLRADPQVRGMFVWQHGVPMSIAGYAGPTPHGIRITSVYTPPEYRRRGYASAGVAALSQHLLDVGLQFCFLFADRANPTSNHVYQSIGYEPVCDVDEYRLG